MIRRLRSAHRVIWLAALVVLPAILGLGLGARRPAPLVAAPAGPQVERLSPVTTWWTGAGVFTITPVGIQGDSALAVEVRNSSSPGAPDLLLYWTRRSEPDRTDDSGDPFLKIDSSDVLLGAAGGTASRLFRLPAEAKGGISTLLLYSLAHQETLGSLELSDGRPHSP